MNDFKKYLDEPSEIDVIEIWFDYPLKEKTIMILKQFNRYF